MKTFLVYYLDSCQHERYLSESLLWSICIEISIQGFSVKTGRGLSVLTSVFTVVEWKCFVVYHLCSHQCSRLLSENALWSICTHISVKGCWVKMIYGLSVLTSVFKVVEWKCSVVYLYSLQCSRLLSENALWSICTPMFKVVEWKHSVVYLYSHQCSRLLSENALWSICTHISVKGCWVKMIYGLSVLTSVFKVVEWKCSVVYLYSLQCSRLLSENALWSICTPMFKVVEWKHSVVYLYSLQCSRLLSENALWSICTHFNVQGCWVKTLCGLSVLTSVFKVVEWKRSVVYLYSLQCSRLLSENTLWSICTHFSVQGCWVKTLCGLSVLTSMFKVVEWKRSVVYLYSLQCSRLLSENTLWSICTHFSVQGCWVKTLCGLSVLTSVFKVVEWKRSVVYLYSLQCSRLLSENTLWSICTHFNVQGC